MKRGFLILTAVILLAALAPAPALADDKSDLAGRAAAWAAAFNAGDGAAVAALYTEDGMRLPPEMPGTLDGREAIAASVGELRGQGIAKVEIKVVEAETHGNVAWGRGVFKLMAADGTVVDKGKWMNVSKKVGGKWLIHRDTWNSARPRE